MTQKKRINIFCITHYFSYLCAQNKEKKTNVHKENNSHPTRVV